MKGAAYRAFQLCTAIIVGGCVLFLQDGAPLKSGSSLVSSAQAIIGRPLTPLSYAGVARRTTRRAVAAGAAAAAAPVVVAPVPACVQVVDAYGRIYRRCP